MLFHHRPPEVCHLLGWSSPTTLSDYHTRRKYNCALLPWNTSLILLLTLSNESLHDTTRITFKKTGSTWPFQNYLKKRFLLFLIESVLPCLKKQVLHGHFSSISLFYLKLLTSTTKQNSFLLCVLFFFFVAMNACHSTKNLLWENNLRWNLERFSCGGEASSC